MEVSMQSKNKTYDFKPISFNEINYNLKNVNSIKTTGYKDSTCGHNYYNWCDFPPRTTHGSCGNNCHNDSNWSIGHNPHPDLSICPLCNKNCLTNFNNQNSMIYLLIGYLLGNNADRDIC